MYFFHVCLIFISLIVLCKGLCPTQSLFTFLQSSAVATTMSMNGQYSLPADGVNAGTVLPGAYVPMKCNDGYVRESGQLNITCIGNSWTTFPTCVARTGSGSMTTTVMASSGGVPCVIDQSSTFNITNGYPTNMTLSYTSNTAATGSIQFACTPGYALDPNIGASYVCNNGHWSTKPRCLMTGRCSFSQLRTFTSTATGLQTTGQSSLMQLPSEADLVLNGSFIMFSCISGYVNTGGSLNVTCGANGAWSKFPNCVMSSSGGSGSTTTTTMPSSGGGVPCVLDPASTLSITNGYPTNIGLSYVSNTAATGSIQFACTPGYALDPSIGASYVCNNGQWSSKPRCLMTGRCSFSQLRTFTTTATGIQTTGQSSLMQLPTEPDSVLNGSYIVFNCISGYVNTGGNLNVTCGANGVWSQYPNCVSNCGDIPVVTNGFVSNATNVQFNNNRYQRQIEIKCNPGFVFANPSSQHWISCTNGVWDPVPACTTSPTCSLSRLQSGLPVGAIISSSSLVRASSSPDILAGGWISIACGGNYKWNPLSGPLNITCLSTGDWTPFPVCTL